MNLDEELQALDNLDRIDALAALDRLEEQEQTTKQEFFRITEQIQKNGMEEMKLTSKLPGLLETRRERALYTTLMMIIRSHQKQLAECTKQMEAQKQELDMLKRAIHVICFNGMKQSELQSCGLPGDYLATVPLMV
jgi:hypothetical protein